MTAYEVEKAAQKFKDEVVQITDAEVVRERLRAMADSKSEAILMQQNLLALGFLLSRVGRGEDATRVLDVCNDLAAYHVSARQVLKEIGIIK